MDLSFSMVLQFGLVWCGVVMCSGGGVVVRFGGSSGGAI